MPRTTKVRSKKAHIPFRLARELITAHINNAHDRYVKRKKGVWQIWVVILFHWVIGNKLLLSCAGRRVPFGNLHSFRCAFHHIQRILTCKQMSEIIQIPSRMGGVAWVRNPDIDERENCCVQCANIDQTLKRGESCAQIAFVIALYFSWYGKAMCRFRTIVTSF